MQAWEELSKEDFDLVLLDLYIDGRRCWETLKRVVSHPAKPVAIVLSCEDTQGNADHAVSLGAYAFLSKPINFLRLENDHRIRTPDGKRVRRSRNSETPPLGVS